MRGSAAFRTGIAPGGALAGPWARNSLWNNARAVPSLDLDFAGTKSLKDNVSDQNLITFTRASSGTYVASDGVLRSAVTNLLLRSEEFGTTWTAFRASITSNALASPNGTVTADKLVEDTTATNTHGVFQTITVANGPAYTFSCYIKAGERTAASLRAGLTGSEANAAFFNLSTGVVLSTGSGYTATITDAGAGWYRCSVTATSSVTSSVFVVTTSIGSNNAYTGDGASGIYLWGAQLEQSSTVGEYIPTSSTINSAPRFDHNPLTGESLGLLVEEARTNLLLRTEEFDNATNWALIGTVTANATTAPNGTITADLATTNGTQAQLSQGITISSGATITGSCFLKPNGINEPEIVLLAGNNTTPYGRATFNVSTGVISVAAATANGGTNASASIQAFANGWYRCSVTVTYPAVTSAGIRINAAGATSGIYLWGAQIEAGSFPTSYIPTTTATVTRAADLASITGSNFSSWYRQDEGTLLSSAASNTQNSGSNYWDFNDGTASNKTVPFISTPTTPNVIYISGGVSFNLSPGAIVLGSRNSLAFGYQLNNFAATLNGGTPVVNSSSAVAVGINKVNIGTNLFGGGSINGTIRRLVYWGQRLPNNVLQAITQ